VLSKILIANRGEIAVRVIRACQELGISTVAVYSELDRDALHVRLADEAYALGGQTAAESYLNTDKILDVIERSGADGVHPGYGFFSENTDFARAITELGVAFIGPPPEAIEVMGDKISSRLAAEKPPGCARRARHHRVHHRPATGRGLRQRAHGYPVAIKAAYGGGGRGMKVVRRRPTRPTTPSSRPSREALKVLRSRRVLRGALPDRPRHVEMQVIGDTARQLRVPRRARLLGPAPPPEAHRGVPRPELPPEIRRDG
jgi:acetyl-CoA/propionyl-CoA carboxylase biotin carboxyl carrier protein